MCAKGHSSSFNPEPMLVNSRVRSNLILHNSTSAASYRIV
jgi:hypothetical protein